VGTEVESQWRWVVAGVVAAEVCRSEPVMCRASLVSAAGCLLLPAVVQQGVVSSFQQVPVSVAAVAQSRCAVVLLHVVTS